MRNHRDHLISYEGRSTDRPFHCEKGLYSDIIKDLEEKEISIFAASSSVLGATFNGGSHICAFFNSLSQPARARAADLLGECFLMMANILNDWGDILLNEYMSNFSAIRTYELHQKAWNSAIDFYEKATERLLPNRHPAIVHRINDDKEKIKKNCL